ncbi:thioredoxin-like protein [Trametes polyzona]|nr:thioredoxin-like protein [Trametes polyzona]
MVQNGHINFYTHVFSPYCYRVQLALDQAKADSTSFIIDLSAKPDWYATKVNSAGKVPAITYGQKTPPENPVTPPGTAKINESLVILEFLNDLFPEAHLLPADPVLAAQARLFIDTWETKGFEGLRDFFFLYKPSNGADKTLLDALDAVQMRLPATGFAIGEWSNADSAVVPFLLCLDLLLKNDLGSYPKEEGLKVYEAFKSARFARLRKYIEDARAYPTVKATWDGEFQAGVWSKLPRLNRDHVGEIGGEL